jgi:tetratricopeptide (TPR) repeat protein
VTSTGAKPAREPDWEAMERSLLDGRREFFVPLAEGARRAGRLDRAIALLEEGLAISPDRVGAWVLLARCKSQQGRLEEAFAHYRWILEKLDARNLPALRALAVRAVAAGDRERAGNYLHRWKREDPLDPEMEDLLAELEGAGEDGAAARDEPGDPSRPGILDIGLAELEQRLMPAPGLADGRAWDEPERPRPDRTGGKED